MEMTPGAVMAVVVRVPNLKSSMSGVNSRIHRIAWSTAARSVAKEAVGLGVVAGWGLEEAGDWGLGEAAGWDLAGAVGWGLGEAAGWGLAEAVGWDLAAVGSGMEEAMGWGFGGHMSSRKASDFGSEGPVRGRLLCQHLALLTLAGWDWENRVRKRRAGL